jgi:hypothetical protein
MTIPVTLFFLQISLVTDALWHDKYGASNGDDRLLTIFHKAAVIFAYASFSPKVILQLKSWIPLNDTTTTPSSVVTPSPTACNCGTDCVSDNSHVRIYALSLFFRCGRYTGIPNCPPVVASVARYGSLPKSSKPRGFFL